MKPSCQHPHGLPQRAAVHSDTRIKIDTVKYIQHTGGNPHDNAIYQGKIQQQYMDVSTV